MGYYGEVVSDVYSVLSGQGEMTIQGMRFKVQWKQRGPYSVVLDNDSLNIALGNTAPWQSSPSVYVQVKSEYIWSTGIEEMHRQTLDVVNDLYMEASFREQVSRVDVFADIAWSKPFQAGDIQKFSKRAKDTNTWEAHGQVTGFTVGKGKIQARIYDKALELRRSGKDWLYDLWEVSQDSQVWRVEFQLRREALKEFGIESFDDLLKASPSLWDYLTGKWLSVRANKRLVSFWEAVQAAKFATGDNPVQFVKRVKMRVGMTWEQAVNQIGGIVESCARRHEIEVYSTAFNELIPRVRQRWIGNQRHKPDG